MSAKLVKSAWSLLFILYSGAIYANQAAQVQQVTTATTQSNQTAAVVELSATVEAVQNAKLAAQQSGLVAKLLVDAGAKVNKGDTLVQLDDTLAQLNLAQAQAGLKAAKVAKVEAERLYQEVLSLSKNKVIAQTLISTRRTNAEIAKAELTKQQANFAVQQEQVRRFKVIAPFNGIIAKRFINLGEWVTPNTQLFTLVSHDQLRLKMAIPQQHFGPLNQALRANTSPGTSSNTSQAINVTISADVDPNNTITLPLSQLVTAADESTRTFTAFVDLPANSNFVAGLSAWVKLAMPAGEQTTVWIPKSAIKQHPDGGASVFIVNNNQVERVIVNVIARNQNQVSVTGLSANQQVVTSGIEVLQTGVKVQIKG